MKKSAKEYWEDRQVETFLNGEKDILVLAKKLKKQYNEAIREIDDKIYSFYGKYSKESGLDITAVRKALNKKELKEFREQMRDFIDFAKENSADPTYLKKLKLLEYKANVSRLEELKANIEMEIAKLKVKTFDEITRTMEVSYEDTYYKNVYNWDEFIGTSTAFVKPNPKVVEKYISQSVNLGNYSLGKDGVWKSVSALSNMLDVRIPQGLILGQNPKKVARIAEKSLGTDYNNAVRLARTEYSYILNQATKDSYKACGINQYQVLAALDERTCDICGEDFDSMIGDYNKIEVGVNYPPFHPNCRCTTIPYFEPDEFDTDDMIYRDKRGQQYELSEGLTYKEWKKGLREHKSGYLHFE